MLSSFYFKVVGRMTDIYICLTAINMAGELINDVIFRNLVLCGKFNGNCFCSLYFCLGFIMFLFRVIHAFGIFQFIVDFYRIICRVWQYSAMLLKCFLILSISSWKSFLYGSSAPCFVIICIFLESANSTQKNKNYWPGKPVILFFYECVE